ncbi:MAG: hypothetical protein V4594_14495 [Bacteroidota bacterium]
MRKTDINIVSTIKSYPFSIIAFVLSLAPWVLVTIAHLNISLNPAPEGYNDYRGEGLLFGVIFAILLAIILLVATVLNLTFQKAKSFYAWLIGVIVVVNLAWYGILSMI